MKTIRSARRLGLLASALLFGLGTANAQPTPPRDAPAPAVRPGTINLQTAPLANPSPESWITFGDGLVAHNNSRATLTPVLPDPARRNGLAVIVAPGGGFKVLAVDQEGWRVAEWFAAHGVSAFVLQYRLKPTPRTPPGSAATWRRCSSPAPSRRGRNSFPSRRRSRTRRPP
jgi:hypothetical protein